MSLKQCKNGCGPLSEWFTTSGKGTPMQCFFCKWGSPWLRHQGPVVTIDEDFERRRQEIERESLLDDPYDPLWLIIWEAIVLGPLLVYHGMRFLE